jgi:hypothetical protein
MAGGPLEMVAVKEAHLIRRLIKHRMKNALGELDGEAKVNTPSKKPREQGDRIG